MASNRDRTVRIDDLARAVGVSVTTVSHALSGKGRVSSETRARVLEAARQLNYRPHPAARSLATGKVGLVAVAASDQGDRPFPFTELPYYSEIVNAAAGVSVSRGVGLVVAPMGAGVETWERLPMDGAIVIDPAVDDPKIAVLAARRIAVVTVGRLIGDVIPGGRRLEVVNDDRAATRSALDHLLLCGAGSIGLLAWPPDDSFSRDSLEGYTSWCEEHSTPSVVETVRVGSWTARGEMRAAAARLLERPDSVDAVYCMFDVMAVELLDLARLRGLRVPEDLMIATVNDAGLGDRTEPPLTTVEANAVELGERATELLLDAIADPSIPSTTHVVPTQLIPRASTSRS